MFKVIPPLHRVVSIVFVIVSSWFSYYAGGIAALILTAVIWAAVTYFSTKVKNIKLDNYFTLYGLLIGTAIVAAGSAYLVEFVNPVGKDKNNEAQEELKPTVVVTEIPGTIVVEAGDGTLSEGDYYYSYIGESARGKEAYLGDKGASATYSVESPGDQYTLWIKVNDDGLHADGARSAKVTVGENQTATYAHVSKVIDGWEWFKMGSFDLIAGKNTVVFEKIENTSAAFVMDEFKFTPE